MQPPFTRVGTWNPDCDYQTLTRPGEGGGATTFFFNREARARAVRGNDAVQCSTGTCQGNYGGLFPLRYRRDIVTPMP